MYLKPLTPEQWCECYYGRANVFNKVDGTQKENSYDPRCRSWYKNSIEVQDKSLLITPYLGPGDGKIYISFARFTKIQQNPSGSI